MMMSKVLKKFVFPWPPSINSLYCQGKTHGQKFLTKQGKAYKQKIIELYANDDMDPINEAIKVRIELFPPDRRTRDIDNYIKPLLDGLKFLEIVADDSVITTLAVIKHEKNIKFNKGLALVYIKTDVKRKNRDETIYAFLKELGLDCPEYAVNFHVETKRSDERYKRELKRQAGE